MSGALKSKITDSPFEKKFIVSMHMHVSYGPMRYLGCGAANKTPPDHTCLHTTTSPQGQVLRSLGRGELCARLACDESIAGAQGALVVQDLLAQGSR
jgi:hypothetical protein